MKIPDRLLPLIEGELIEDVLGQLQSGKEAEVYLVLAEGEVLCAKVYKEAKQRTFKAKSQYLEGRKSRNTRDARAMGRGSRHGKKEAEEEWQNTEVESLYLLSAAGVQVPKPLAFFAGVLLLEMIVDEDGNPAPRLNDVELTREQAVFYHAVMMRQVVLMLCAGIVHGDLSEFNILLSHQGLVIIDLPQAVQATSNNAFRIFERDMIQLGAYFGRAAPELTTTGHAKEIWALYKNGRLRPDSILTGRFVDTAKKADVGAILDEIDDAREDAFDRRRTPK